MSDLKNYIERRKQSDFEFAEGLESGYLKFKWQIYQGDSKVKKG